MIQSQTNGTEPKQNKNIACRIFKEQIDLINQLPENERIIVLYEAINNSFNQFENQNDKQSENQNEIAYVSVSVSLSELSKSILNLLSKNIVTKEFSNNYGGKREGAGRNKPNTKPSKSQPKLPNARPKKPKEDFIHPSFEEVKDYAIKRGYEHIARKFFDYFDTGNWIDSKGNSVKNWKQKFITWENQSQPVKQTFEY